jgi:hypothetical protein
MKILNFFYICRSFCPLGSGSGSSISNYCGSMRFRIHNPALTNSYIGVGSSAVPAHDGEEDHEDQLDHVAPHQQRDHLHSSYQWLYRGWQQCRSCPWWGGRPWRPAGSRSSTLTEGPPAQLLPMVILGLAAVPFLPMMGRKSMKTSWIT